jgi:RNA polymerase sigma-70 factor (ECF subfamily)
VPLSKEHSDTELLTLLSTDGEAGMSLIFKQYYGFLCQVIARILPFGQVAEDIAQDVFYDVWKKRDSLLVHVSLRAYLRRAGVNRALNHIRDQKIKWDDEDKLEFQKSASHDVVQSLYGEELGALVERTIDGLPERCRLIFTLSRFEEMTYQEIADQLGISIKTVENQMTKALKILKETIEPVIRGK